MYIYSQFELNKILVLIMAKIVYFVCSCSLCLYVA